MRESVNARNCDAGVLNVTGTKCDQPTDHFMSHKRVDVSTNAEIIEFGRYQLSAPVAVLLAAMNRSPST